MNYIIGKISLDEQDKFYITYIGDIPEQGGLRFGESTIKIDNIEDGIEFLKSQIKRNISEYKKIIASKKLN